MNQTYTFDPNMGTAELCAALHEQWPSGHGFAEDYPVGGERNGYRASLAAPAVLAYAERTKARDEPIEQTIRDLISDLMHLADLLHDEDDPQAEYDFITLSAQAGSRYQEEIDGE